jgi:nucleoside-diphosphate-sugar epimerase
MEVAAAATQLDGFIPINAATEIKSVWEVANLVAQAASRRGLRVNIVSEEETSQSSPEIRFRSRLDLCPEHNLLEGIEETLDYWQKVAS